MKIHFLIFITWSIYFLFLPQISFAQNPGRIDAVDNTVYMLTYDHGGLILWGNEHFKERMDNAIAWLDKYPTFKIGLENESHIYDYFAENDTLLLDEIKSNLKKYNSRFAIGSCTYGQPLAQFVNEESNIRQILYSIQATEKYFNYRPPVYLMSEHAMHSQVPQILKGFEFEGAIMRTHYMMYGYNPTFDVPIGWWVGLDNSRIPTVPTYPGEGAEFGRTTIDNWILTRYPGPDAKESMVDYRKKFSHIHPLLATRADDSGLRKEELVREYENNPQFKWILLDELLQDFPEPKEEMVTKPNDYTVRMPWGYCGNVIWNMSRKAEMNVLTAERLAAIEMLYGGQDREPKLREAWKKLLLAQHHDVQIVGLLPEAHELLPASADLSEQVINDAMKFMAENMEGEGIKQITVFNPLSWTQKKWITTKVSFTKGEAMAIQVKNGQHMQTSRVISAYYYSDKSILEAEIAFEAELPPLSVVSYSLFPANQLPEESFQKISIDEEKLIINTPFYEIKLAEGGGIDYLKESETERYISKPDQEAAYLAGTIDGVSRKSEGRWIIQKFGKGTPWAKAVEYGFIGSIPYQFEIVLYENSARIECKLEFDFYGEKIGLLSENQRDSHAPFVHEEKLRFKFFPNLDENATGYRDLPFAVAQTDGHYVEGNYWTTLADSINGMAFFNKGNMGSIKEEDGSFSIPLAYAMYYIWGTRMLNGSFTYEFALYPYSGTWKEADVHKRALEFNFPVPYVESYPGNGKFGQSVKAISSVSENVILTALYQADKKVYARFFDYKGEGGVLSFIGQPNMNQVEEVNLLGNRMRTLPPKVDFKPWQFRTFLLKSLND